MSREAARACARGGAALQREGRAILVHRLLYASHVQAASMSVRGPTVGPGSLCKARRSVLAGAVPALAYWRAHSYHAHGAWPCVRARVYLRACSNACSQACMPASDGSSLLHIFPPSVLMERLQRRWCRVRARVRVLRCGLFLLLVHDTRVATSCASSGWVPGGCASWLALWNVF